MVSRHVYRGVVFTRGSISQQSSPNAVVFPRDLGVSKMGVVDFPANQP